MKRAVAGRLACFGNQGCSAILDVVSWKICKLRLRNYNQEQDPCEESLAHLYRKLHLTGAASFATEPETQAALFQQTPRAPRRIWQKRFDEFQLLSSDFSPSLPLLLPNLG